MARLPCHARPAPPMYLVEAALAGSVVTEQQLNAIVQASSLHTVCRLLQLCLADCQPGPSAASRLQIHTRVTDTTGTALSRFRRVLDHKHPECRRTAQMSTLVGTWQVWALRVCPGSSAACLASLLDDSTPPILGQAVGRIVCLLRATCPAECDQALPRQAKATQPLDSCMLAKASCVEASYAALICVSAGPGPITPPHFITQCLKGRGLHQASVHSVLHTPALRASPGIPSRSRSPARGPGRRSRPHPPGLGAC